VRAEFWRTGTCVSWVAEYGPIALAKALATLDFLSGGRLTLGFGYAWNHAVRYLV
jgi:alkanesulfonate monooxygenase SsuD/methylene tetrahydromethanopterin reductase-like flavin-dependent oxidoreductase (luciferase family)